MQLKHSTKKLYLKLATTSILVFGAALIVPEFYVGASAEENTDNTIDPSAYSVTIKKTSENIGLTLETVPYTNVIRAGKDTVETEIKAPTGTQSQFHLLVSTDATDNALHNGANTIPATSGTLENPVPLTSNEWGFALASTTPGLPTNGFNESYDIPAPSASSKWAAVPSMGNEQLIQTLSMNQPTGKTSTDIYYAVSAKDDLAEGTYTGTVVYTAMYDASEANEMEVVSPVPFEGANGTVITLNTSAFISSEDPGSVEIKLGDTPCDNPVAYTTTDGQVQVKCTVPELPASGNYTVTAKLDKTGVTYTAPQQFAYTKALVFNIRYNANSGSGVPDTQTYVPTDSETDHTFTLTEGVIPTRDGYTFGGWTTVATNQAAAYSPGSELYLKEDSPTVTLYAIWVPNNEMGFNNAGITKMQEMTSSICAAAANGTTGRLQDARDYKIYHITKLADGKCWMTQNLSLDIREKDSEGNPYKYTSADTNLISVSEWKPGEATSSRYKSTIPYNKLSNTTWSDEAYYPYSYNPGDSYFVPATPLTTDDEVETTTGDAHQATGNYYNWTAAKVSNNSYSQRGIGSSSPDSICPAGWALPNSESEPSDFGTMFFAQGVTVDSAAYSLYQPDGFNLIRSAPIYFIRAGLVNSGNRYYQGNTGLYWLRTSYNGGNAYYAGIRAEVELALSMDMQGRSAGQPVRCLAL